MNNKIGLVTMCRKAGKLVMGMDMVKDACKSAESYLTPWRADGCS